MSALDAAARPYHGAVGQPERQADVAAIVNVPAGNDPAGAQAIRDAYVEQTVAHYQALEARTRQDIGDDDLLGIDDDDDRTPNQRTLAFRQWYEEHADRLGLAGVSTAQVAAFDYDAAHELPPTAEATIFDVEYTINGEYPWFRAAVEEAYAQGIEAAYSRLARRATHDLAPVWEAFASPRHRAAFRTVMGVQEAAHRTVARALGKDMQRVVAATVHPADLQATVSSEGLVNRLLDRIDKVGYTRGSVLGHTEVTRIVNQAAIEEYLRAGVERVAVDAEYTTAGDDRVCEQCAPFEGQRMPIADARELLPQHALCRCFLIPAE